MDCSTRQLHGPIDDVSLTLIAMVVAMVRSGRSCQARCLAKSGPFLKLELKHRFKEMGLCRHTTPYPRFRQPNKGYIQNSEPLVFSTVDVCATGVEHASTLWPNGQGVGSTHNLVRGLPPVQPRATCGNTMLSRFESWQSRLCQVASHVCIIPCVIAPLPRG